MFDKIVARFVINRAKSDPRAFFNWLSENLSPEEYTTRLAEATARYYAGAVRQFGWRTPDIYREILAKESPASYDRLYSTARPEDSHSG